jgi:hypothetical protein
MGRDELRRTSLPVTATRGFLISALCGLCLLGPLAGFFVGFYPDWAFAQLIVAERIPSAVSLIAIVSVCAVTPATFAWAASCIRRHALAEIIRVGILLLVLFLVCLAVLGHRILVTPMEGLEIQEEFISRTHLGVSLLWMDGCFVVGVLGAGLQLQAMGKKA